MPSESAIEWTDAAWNPVTGCTKVSQGCKNCYAEALFPRAYGERKFTDVRIHPERLDWPLRWRGSPKAKAEGRPSRIFVNSMSDLFHEHVTYHFVRKVLLAMEPREGKLNFTFQVLTKRPERMREFFDHCWTDEHGEATKVLSNLWLGVSVEDQATADERIPILLQTPAAVRWVSYEPALGPVDFFKFLPRRVTAACDMSYAALDCGALEEWYPGLDWVVAGGESGPRARPPHPDWFRSVRDQCAAVGVPFFFKQWGAWAPCPLPDPMSASLVMVHNGHDEGMDFMGKKKAGCLLDGREWKQFPKL